MVFDKYQAFIEDCLEVIDKNGDIVGFILNNVQKRFTQTADSLRIIILKARQQGFSSLVLAIFTADFILKQNSRSVVVADSTDNAIELLDRVKMYLKSYEYRTKTPVILKYNSKYELFNEVMNSRYSIGTAENSEFGRSKTITNLHLSEAAFYPNMSKLLAGALQAVVPTGRVIIETTANGFNEFKTFWDRSVEGKTGFLPLFFKASDFYPPEFLEIKKNELQRLYTQEYPDSPEEAFITSGNPFFKADSLKYYLEQVGGLSAA